MLSAPVIALGCFTTLAAVLFLPSEATLRGRVAGPGSDDRRRMRLGPGFLVLVVAALAGGVGTLGPRTALQIAIAATVFVAVSGLVTRVRRRRLVLEVADRVLEACTALADELRAGRSPEVALDLAARGCPELQPAVRAVQLGADVPEALRRVRHRDLRLMAAAWQVSHRSGDGLGDALARVAAGLRSSRATRAVVGSELASARSTARLLVALPGLALMAGSGGGGRPWAFLLTTGVGTICLVAGLSLALAGLWWIELIATGVEQES